MSRVSGGYGRSGDTRGTRSSKMNREGREKANEQVWGYEREPELVVQRSRERVAPANFPFKRHITVMDVQPQ